MSEYEEENLNFDDDVEEFINDLKQNPSEFTKLHNKYLAEGMNYKEAYLKASKELHEDE